MTNYDCSAAKLADLKSQRDKLERALLLGARQVQHDGKMVTYRSLAEMRALIASIDRHLTECDRTRRKHTRQIRLTTRRGL